MVLEGTAQPETLTSGLAILVVGLYGVTGYAGMRMWSPISLLTWAISITALVVAIVLSLDFIYVWLSIAIVALVEAFAMILHAGGYGTP